jgi:hypothetical protein
VHLGSADVLLWRVVGVERQGAAKVFCPQTFCSQPGADAVRLQGETPNTKRKAAIGGGISPGSLTI